MQQVPNDVITAIREGQPLSVPRWEALRVLTQEIVNARGSGRILDGGWWHPERPSGRRWRRNLPGRGSLNKSTKKG